MKATLTLHSILLLKCDRWPRNLNPAKPLPNTSNSIHPACRVPLKSVSYDIIILTYHLRRKKSSKKPNPSKGTKPPQPQQQKQVNQHQSYDKNPNQCTRCGDSPHPQGFNCPGKKYQCKQCTKIRHFTKMCFTKNAHLQPQEYYRGEPKHSRLLYLNILLSHIKMHTNVILMSL